MLVAWPVSAADITVDFDAFAALPFAPGTPVPTESRFDTELLKDFGLTFAWMIFGRQVHRGSGQVDFLRI
jgi:hypothetical protein